MNQLAIIDTENAFALDTFHVPPELEASRYRIMAQEYHAVCIKRPFVNRSMLALTLCSKYFDLPINVLQSPFGPRQGSAIRHKMMAFCRVVSEPPFVNPWKRIGKVFNCHHSMVIYATHKYGGQIEAALQENVP